MYLENINTQALQQVREFTQNELNELNPLDVLNETAEMLTGENDLELQDANSNDAMKKEDLTMMNEGTENARTETTMVAGGCFWCVEADLEKLSGVIRAVSGYAEGSTENPTYSDYAQNGHREVVEVTYNPDVVSFEQILIYAMKHMDPTDGDGSFHDRGEYYAPAFYYENETQKSIIGNLLSEVDEYGPYDKPLAVDVVKLPIFWEAEEYHQDYYKGTLSQLKYKYYRSGSGRDAYIEKYWGNDTGPTLSWRSSIAANNKTSGFWKNYTKPDVVTLKNIMDTLAFKVTQEEGTETAFSSSYDKFWDDGIYVDILSGEPLYSSKDKFDSGTGWPSFVKPITENAVTEHIDKKLFSTRTEIRSAIADNHIGHVFEDGPSDRGGLRYCMNGVALKFVAKADLEAEGYGDYVYIFN